MKQYQKNVAFLGTGSMGSALIVGALESGILKAGSISAYDQDRSRLKEISNRCRIKRASSSGEAAKNSDFIFLCVKPQQMKELLSEIKGCVSGRKCLISIAAGISSRSIEDAFSVKVPVIRVMPNTPALVGLGAAAIARGRFASSSDIKFAVDFFSSVGEAVVLPEKHFDAVTAVSGSGPAYLFYLAEALESAALKLGLPKGAAELLVRQTLLGAGKMVKGCSSPGELRKRVTSPGGTTESAVKFLESHRWPEIFIQAVKKAKERSQQLSELNR